MREEYQRATAENIGQLIYDWPAARAPEPKPAAKTIKDGGQGFRARMSERIDKSQLLGFGGVRSRIFPREATLCSSGQEMAVSLRS